jgi:hypothetical protein
LTRLFATSFLSGYFPSLTVTMASPPHPKPLRSGTWSIEEEEYVAGLINAFKAGSLSRARVEEGTSLRAFLAKALHCRPKRVSKKLENTRYNGKCVYRRDSSLSGNEEMECEKTIQALEERFWKACKTIEVLSGPSLCFKKGGGHPVSGAPLGSGLSRFSASSHPVPSSDALRAEASKHSASGDALALLRNLTAVSLARPSTIALNQPPVLSPEDLEMRLTAQLLDPVLGRASMFSSKQDALSLKAAILHREMLELELLRSRVASVTSAQLLSGMRQMKRFHSDDLESIETKRRRFF